MVGSQANIEIVWDLWTGEVFHNLSQDRFLYSRNSLQEEGGLPARRLTGEPFHFVRDFLPGVN